MGLCGKMSSDLTRALMMFFIAVTILARAFLIDSVPLTPVSYKVPELDDDIVYYYIGKSVPHRLGGLGTQFTPLPKPKGNPFQTNPLPHCYTWPQR